MRDIWSRIEAWLRTHAPVLLESLEPGASAEQLDQAERELGRPLPGDFRESYLIHNGQRTVPALMCVPRLINGTELYCLDEVLSTWQDLSCAPAPESSGRLVRTLGPVLPLWNTQSRIPFAGEFERYYDMLDFDPGPGGTPGQVVRTHHYEPFVCIIDKSFRAWMETFVYLLEGGVYSFRPDLGGLVTAEEAADGGF